MTTILCAVCNAPMRVVGPSWSLRCDRCGTWASSLSMGINTDSAAHMQLDEDLRETGLAALRKENNQTIVHRLRDQGAGPGSHVLDVGCAHGWFLRATSDAGFKAEGIEPDQAVADRALSDAGPIRVGYFPDVLEDAETFDVISFNDVLEHFPDARSAVAASYQHLRPGGLLSLNIPSSDGIVYRLAAALRRIGIRSPFERLWQVGLPSPHMWFFDPKGLADLCRQEGFEVVLNARLKSASRKGLWERVHADRRPSVVSVVGVAAIWLGAPVVSADRWSDIIHLIARRPEHN